MEGISHTDLPFRILVVGSGRLGRTILHSFADGVTGLLSRHPERAERYFSDHGYQIPVFADLVEIDPESFDLFWLAVPDDGIESQVEEAGGKIRDWKGKLVVHSSGATSLKELDPLRDLGAETAVLHPNLILSGETTFPEWTIWGVTFSNAHIRSSIAHLLRPYSSSLIEIPDNRRQLYHVAATLTANYPMILFQMASEIYQTIGIPDDIAVRLVREYMQESLNAVAGKGFHAGLTGPVARGDHATIEEHYEAIRTEFPRFLAFFRELVETTARELRGR